MMVLAICDNNINQCWLICVLKGAEDGTASMLPGKRKRRRPKVTEEDVELR